MTGIGERIRERRERLGWTVTKLAVLAGYSQSYISRIETGRKRYNSEALQRICGALGISVQGLFASTSNVTDASIGHRAIPVLNYLQAARWTGVDFSPNEDAVRETIMTDLEHPPSTFAVRICDESMVPRFNEGDIVVIDPTIQPKPGDCVVATEQNGEATFKQYRSLGLNERGQDVFELVPLNPVYAPVRSDRQTIAIVGVMVEHRIYRKR